MESNRYSFQILMTLESSRKFSKNTQIRNFEKSVSRCRVFPCRKTARQAWQS